MQSGSSVDAVLVDIDALRMLSQEVFDVVQLGSRLEKISKLFLRLRAEVGAVGLHRDHDGLDRQVSHRTHGLQHLVVLGRKLWLLVHVRMVLGNSGSLTFFVFKMVGTPLFV